MSIDLTGGSAIVRVANRNDAATLAAIGAETFVETFGHLYKAEDLSAFLAKSHSAAVYEGLLSDDRWALWIAESETGALAYCVAGPCSLPVPNMPENSGELARLYIRKEGQGMKLGALMLKIALDWMRPRFEHIYLSVYQQNFRAQRLYERFGFVRIHDYFFMVGDHADPEWIMELRE
jgi:ribosomal protein S18 acetylase RimI-like enzyme